MRGRPRADRRAYLSPFTPCSVQRHNVVFVFPLLPFPFPLRSAVTIQTAAAALSSLATLSLSTSPPVQADADATNDEAGDAAAAQDSQQQSTTTELSAGGITIKNGKKRGMIFKCESCSKVWGFFASCVIRGFAHTHMPNPGIPSPVLSYQASCVSFRPLRAVPLLIESCGHFRLGAFPALARSLEVPPQQASASPVA